MRRKAFLEAGGFHHRYLIGGEEELLAIDMASNGWELRYFDSIIAFHHPELATQNVSSHSQTARHNRKALMIRNALWSTWLRSRKAATDAQVTRGLLAAEYRGLFLSADPSPSRLLLL